MALPVLRNRVKANTATTGTGPLLPGPATLHYRSFPGAALPTGSVFPYAIEVPSGAWEVGVGTMNADGSIARAFEDSSTGALLNLTGEAGTTIALVTSAGFFGLVAQGGSGLAAPAAGNTVTGLSPTALLLAYDAGSAVYMAPLDFLGAFGDRLTDTGLSAAAALSDGDRLWINQGNPSDVFATMAQAWSYVQTKLLANQPATIPVTGALVLSAVAHNTRILVATGDVALSAATFAGLGDGFRCELLVTGSNNVTFGAGITASNGAAAFGGPGSLSIRATSARVPAGEVFVQVPGGTAPKINLTPPTGVQPGTSYSITGRLSGYASAPTLTVSVDGGAYGALPAGSTVTGTTLNLSMAGLLMGGHTVAVQDSSGVVSNTVTFAVVANSISVTTPSGWQGNTASPIGGGYLGVLPTGVSVGFDGATPSIEVSNFLASGGTWSGTIAAPANGTHTLTVREDNATSVTATTPSFTVSGGAVGPVLTLTGATFGPGKFGQALTGGLGVATVVAPAGARTISLWFRSPAANGGGPLIMDTATITGIAIDANGGAFMWQNSSHTGSSGNICDGLWHNLELDWQTDGASFAVDGVPFTGGGSAPWLANPTYTISAAGGASKDGYGSATGCGQIDEVCVFSPNIHPSNSTFTPATAATTSAAPNLIAAWHLDGDGTSA